MRAHHKKGYTIIEILVYLAIFTLVSVGTINSLVIIVKSFGEIRSNRAIIDSGSLAMERMTREIRNASSIDTANSTLASNPGVLTLNTTDSSGTAKTVKFMTSNNVLVLYEDGSLSGNLLGQGIQVTNLVFTSITMTNGTAVKVAMTIQDTKSARLQSQDFYSTIILRGSY
jgi:type II secretory pathway component PulJ